MTQSKSLSEIKVVKTYKLNNESDFRNKVLRYIDLHKTGYSFTKSPIDYPCVAHINENLKVVYSY